MTALTCRCGHPLDAHEHYRPGHDCAACRCVTYKAERSTAADLAGSVLLLAVVWVLAALWLIAMGGGS